MPSTTVPTTHTLPTSAIPLNPPNLSTKLPKLTPRTKKAKTSNPEPFPETPALAPPPNQGSLHFTVPTRRVLSPKDHELFQASSTHTLIVSFLFSLADSVIDTPISAVSSKDTHPVVQHILDILSKVEDVVRNSPPENQEGSRFGNKGFRDFLDGVETRQKSWYPGLGIDDKAAIDELSTYFLQSFGNRTRIDYGSGHELNFMIWLLCLYQTHLLPPSTFPQITLLVFPRYLSLMRLIQATYYLEPAGSHGVWGLDDYQFLPFLFGSSQLLHHPFITPLSIHQTLILEEYGKDYLYLDQVNFVNSVKNVESLRWHSPMLDDISAAKNWEKVHAGMRRMFIKEVLGKLPVMQHFLFGSCVPAVAGMSVEEAAGVGSEEAESEGGEIVVMKDGMRHVHQGNTWGDCCGIKVPSSIGAAQEMKKRMGDSELRRVPFD